LAGYQHAQLHVALAGLHHLQQAQALVPFGGGISGLRAVSRSGCSGIR
jgi:hypothetical protein